MTSHREDVGLQQWYNGEYLELSRNCPGSRMPTVDDRGERRSLGRGAREANNFPFHFLIGVLSTLAS